MKDRNFDESWFDTEPHPFLVETGDTTDSGYLGRSAYVNELPNWIEHYYPDFAHQLRWQAGSAIERLFLVVQNPKEAVDDEDADLQNRKVLWSAFVDGSDEDPSVEVVLSPGIQHFGVYHATRFRHSSSGSGSGGSTSWKVVFWVGVTLHPSVFVRNGQAGLAEFVPNAGIDGIPDYLRDNFGRGWHTGLANRFNLFMSAVTAVHARVMWQKGSGGLWPGNSRKYPCGGVDTESDLWGCWGDTVGARWDLSDEFIYDADGDRVDALTGEYSKIDADGDLYSFPGELGFTAFQATVSGGARSLGGNMVRAVVYVPMDMDADTTEAEAVQMAWDCAFGGRVQTHLKIGYVAGESSATEITRVVSQKKWSADALVDLCSFVDNFQEHFGDDDFAKYLFNRYDLATRVAEVEAGGAAVCRGG